MESRVIKLIAIAVDSPRNLRKLHERYQSPFQYIADRGGEIAKNYNVYFTKDQPDPEHIHDEFQDNHAIPSKFLINKEGIIVWQDVGNKENRPLMETVIDAIEKNL
ncbi:MAG: redoxin domain-containing protein [Candidatus Helarchaeota archaeon]|nr:redoxin domain-containing protein [Candidatus Helarchaeota archaeon]